jgi:hypothetical protein
MRPSFRSGTLLISMSLTAACTTHITVIGPGPTTTAAGAVVASCQANAKSVETALEAYDTQMGAYPLADDWDALTTSQMGSHGSVGPWLKGDSQHYPLRDQLRWKRGCIGRQGRGHDVPSCRQHRQPTRCLYHQSQLNSRWVPFHVASNE